MAELMLGQKILREVEKFEDDIEKLVNQDKKYKVDIIVKYEFKMVNGKIRDTFLLDATYGRNVDLDSSFAFETNSLSIGYINQIAKVIRELTDKEFNTKEEYFDEFEKLYHQETGFYILTLTSVNIY
ncbi:MULTISPECIES: hypothetical protein [unclassified Clostridium]|uniref:hypothetical protein n=1 Tax=unclassified Clostridium TaxID=2614128 RepID=UPI0025BFC54E|nr:MULTISPECIES: hypothetical protein [unclassified Clostridium]